MLIKFVTPPSEKSAPRYAGNFIGLCFVSSAEAQWANWENSIMKLESLARSKN